MKHQRGFSIIEIAVVLIVVGMLLMSAIPTMTEWMRNARLRNQAEALQAGLSQARNEALRRNQPVSFFLVRGDSANALDSSCELSAAGTSWVISVRDPAGACGAAPAVTSTDSDDPLIVATHVGADGASGVSVSGLATDGTTAANTITFDALGRASGTLRRIDVRYDTAQDGDRPLRVNVSAAGMVRTCDTTVTASDDPRRCITDTGSDASGGSGSGGSSGTGGDTPISTNENDHGSNDVVPNTQE
jgi:type IV fimbrial biogenesis protein FimT